MSLILQSPAKLNVYLKALKKRPDGFHEIQTIFERISLCDEIRLKSNSSGKIVIKCKHPHVPTGSKNLCYKVARLLKDECHIIKGVDIVIKKRIPVAAGLGGGSSNAATMLLGLNQLWQLGLSKSKLVAYAKEIGSDVPFFLYDSPWALGTGRGDCIKKINLKTKMWHILITPKIKLYASKVYGALNLQLTKNRDNANILIDYLKDNNIKGVEKSLLNDLEQPVLRLSPQLKRLKKRLKSLNIKGVMISGSGPSVFGITESEKHAKDIQKLFKKQYSQVFVVETM